MWKLKIAEGNNEPWLTTTNGHIGRQHWEFDPDAGTPEERLEVERVRLEFKKNRFQQQQSSDLLMRMQLRKENPCMPIPPAVKVGENEDITEAAVTTTVRRGLSFYSSIQAHDGHWPAENAGTSFFVQPLIMVLYVTGAMNVILSPEHRKEIIRYLYNHQNEDGGWGLHIEHQSTMFASTLSYVALRLLGEGPEDGEAKAMARGQKWILDHGGAVNVPSWGKFWLSVCGMHEWAGCNPMPPEFWLLPKYLPLHPGKLMFYCRLTYVPMSYIYGKRFVGPITPLVLSLRQELYTEPYHEINWKNVRNMCGKEDIYNPRPLLQSMAWEFLYNVVEPIMTYRPFCVLRERAMEVAINSIHYEDENSNYFSTGCSGKVLNMLVCWLEDPNSEAYRFHLARIVDYWWVAEDGLKMQTFGSQTWDAEFGIQAIISSDLNEEYGPMISKAFNFLKASQVRENPTGNFTNMWRHISKGSWTFSIQDHGWQVSDCTAEGLKVALLLSQLSPQLVGEKMEAECLYDAVNVILSLQSSNGGFPGWEPQTAFQFLEKLNPIEFLEGAVIETEYVECTSSVIQALVLFKKLYPKHRIKEVENCISRALRYIEDTQNPNGSWYGQWGICYTYGTMFGVKALSACGKNYHNSFAQRKACEFLLSKQLPGGGWGESYLSSRNKVYTNLDGNRSHLVHTSWAVLSLLDAGLMDKSLAAIHRGVKLLINAQMEDGDFPQQDISGVFMRTCALNYSLYRNTFPIWALGEYRRRVMLP